jgi:hypothetical protein
LTYVLADQPLFSASACKMRTPRLLLAWLYFTILDSNHDAIEVIDIESDAARSETPISICFCLPALLENRFMADFGECCLRERSKRGR